MRHLKTTLAVVGAAVILALAGNTVALAATGQNFLLGKTNLASTVTTVERTTAGPAFKITNDTPASAPFVTNGTGKVTNLNADKLDGLSSSGFAAAPLGWGYVNTNGTISNAHNATAVWDAGDGWYEITIPGEEIFYSDYLPTITPSCENKTVGYGSVSGKLVVEFGAGDTQCAFAFSIQKIG
jgi:hypothetical protein